MLWLALRAASGLLEALVAEPGFDELFQPLAIVPLLGALTVVLRAALRRDDRGTALAAATTTALIAGGGVAVSLAWAGAWSLVAQIVVQRLVEGVLLWSIVGRQIGIGWSAAHFTDLVEALDARAFAAASPAVSRYTACLIVGVALGPTATGLYMLAARLPEALTELCLAGEPRREWRAQLRHACRVALPVALATTLLPVALPPLIDLRWWGAVLPAQILLLDAIPTALLTVGTDDARGTAAEIKAGARITQLCGPCKQYRRICGVVGYPGTGKMHQTERELRSIMVAVSGLPVMARRPCVVDGDAEAVGVQHAQSVLALGVAITRRGLVPETGLVVIDLARATTRVKDRGTGLRRRMALLGRRERPTQRLGLVTLHGQPVR
jgi:hypothetical protein